MTDSPDSTDPSTTDPTTIAAPEPHAALDVEAEKERLADLGRRDAELAAKAEADLEVGGAGRTFTDAGVRSQVEDGGDTAHPTDL